MRFHEVLLGNQHEITSKHHNGKVRDLDQASMMAKSPAELLGQLIVSKLQLAAMSRMDIPKAARRPFYLYMDEF
jgi:hypothetical protein